MLPAAAAAYIHSCAWLYALQRLELQQLLTLTKEQLGLVQALLGGEDEVAHLKSENQALRQQLQVGSPGA